MLYIDNQRVVIARRSDLKKNYKNYPRTGITVDMLTKPAIEAVRSSALALFVDDENNTSILYSATNLEE